MDSGVTTRWWWVRHAPIAAPNDGRINGNSDVDVVIDGGFRFAYLARRLPVDALWLTSALSRTAKTATAVFAAGLKAHPLVAEPDLNEQNFGAWTGKTWADVDADPVATAFWADPAHAPAPLGESFADQVNRVGAVMARINGENPNRDIVAVAHAGTIRAALAVALDVDPSVALAFKVDTLSLTRLDHIATAHAGWRGGAWAVQAVNETAEHPQ